MIVEVLLVFESPETGVRGSRKMWLATCRDSKVIIGWGRIPPGNKMQVDYLPRHAAQHQDYSFKTGEEALNFIQKKVTEKVSKGYSTIKNEVDGVSFAFGTTDGGFLKMKTWNGTN